MLDNTAIDLYEDGEESVENIGFTIDGIDKAEWAIRKVKNARQRHELYISAAKHSIETLTRKIEQAKEKCESETSFLLCALDEFLNDLPAKETKTQLSFELPSGKLIRKKSKLDFEKNEEELFNYVRENAPEYLKEKITETVAWGELKKNLSIVEGEVVNTETGEIISGVVAIEKPSKFDIE